MSHPEISSATPPDQSAVYRRFIHLQSICDQQLSGDRTHGLAGLLLLCLGFDRKGAELALATTIAGGTFLGIDPSAEHLKAALRNGSCDFMVNTLDESLRVLKNELRKKKPLSVGLLAEASAILPAMLERGVQPDLIGAANPSQLDHPSPSALLPFIERGAISVNSPASSQSTGLLPVAWTAASISDLRRMDQLALLQLPADDIVRRRWLQQAPAYFHRQRPFARSLEMRSEEASRLAEQFQHAISVGEIQPPATFMRHAPDGSNQTITLQPS